MTDLHPLDRGSLLAEIRSVLQEPRSEETWPDGSQVFVGGDPGEVVVRTTRSRLTVSVFAVVWEGPHSPVVRPQPLVTLCWKRLPSARLTSILYETIETARQLRRAKYRKCERCGEAMPPEWMHDDQTCHSCAERHLGVVH